MFALLNQISGGVINEPTIGEPGYISVGEYLPSMHEDPEINPYHHKNNDNNQYYHYYCY